MFNLNGMEKPIIVVCGVKFADLCLILEFAYKGSVQVPHERLNDFIKAGEILQIRGIKEGRIQFMTNHLQQPATVARTYEPTVPSSQEAYSEPSAKRLREDEEITIQEASEIMKMLLDNPEELDSDQSKVALAPQGSSLGSMTPMPAYLQTMIGPKLTNVQPQQQVGHGSFPSPRIVSKTIMEVKDKPTYSCRFCSRSLSTQGRIKKHENECNENPDRVIAVCEVCHMEMKPSSLNHHKNVKHGIRGKNLSLVLAANLNHSMLTPPLSPHAYRMISADTTNKSPDASKAEESSPTHDSHSEDDVTLQQIKEEMKDTDVPMQV